MRLSEHRPTGFDHSAAEFFDFDDPRREWLVAPVCQTRDSGPLSRSNFEVALRELGGESETVEVHRFGHWGPGWYEIIIVDPSRESEVEDLERALSRYPVLDDEDHSRREFDDAVKTWRNCWVNRDFARAIISRLEEWPGQYECCERALDSLDLFSEYMDRADVPYEQDSTGAYFPESSILQASRTFNRKQVVQLIWAARKSA
jgi:hypothetical protein